MPLSAVLTGFMTGAGLIIAIGAQNAFVLRQGLQRNHILLVVAICALGDIMLIALGVAGIGALVLEWPQLLQILRFGGAFFLAIYGLLAVRRAWCSTPGLNPRQDSESNRARVVLTCLAFTFLNPHVYLDTMVLVGSLATRYPASSMQWIFGLGAMTASLVWFFCLGFGARLLRPVFCKPQTWRLLDGAIAIFMFTLCGILLLHPLN